MVFSPDFLDFFVQLAPLLHRDSSILCISSWNDNGFSDDGGSPTRLYRTDFFVGLGWLVSRKTVRELVTSQLWPSSHWDHWLRAPEQRRDRECIYPEVSRNHNIGVEGTHSNQDFFNKYFANVPLHSGRHTYLGDLSFLEEKNYELFMRTQILNKTHSVIIQDLSEMYFWETKNFQENEAEKLYVILLDDTEYWTSWEIALSYFGLWSSSYMQAPFRGTHHSSIFFRKFGRRFLLIGSHSAYASFFQERLQDLGIFNYLGISPSDLTIPPPQPLPTEIQGIIGNVGVSCDVTCRDASSVCDADALPFLNHCFYLRKHFQCESCGKNLGGDQPAFVESKEDPLAHACLVNTDTSLFSCSGRHPHTRRLCPCKK
eukprot:TRINITY_DN3010_c0_g1_i3.p1 TRINITY_DN3010_c0_g1~~TRINITY_DN3010_c0_g1_i3.p1  ORF type:complete len:372 (+),score=65.81 TRINITY_DN3010_c0_g1_i3:646-1761(+)